MIQRVLIQRPDPLLRIFIFKGLLPALLFHNGASDLVRDVKKQDDYRYDEQCKEYLQELLPELRVIIIFLFIELVIFFIIQIRRSRLIIHVLETDCHIGFRHDPLILRCRLERHPSESVDVDLSPRMAGLPGHIDL